MIDPVTSTSADEKLPSTALHHMTSHRTPQPTPSESDKFMADLLHNVDASPSSNVSRTPRSQHRQRPSLRDLAVSALKQGAQKSTPTASTASATPLSSRPTPSPTLFKGTTPPTKKKFTSIPTVHPESAQHQTPGASTSQPRASLAKSTSDANSHSQSVAGPSRISFDGKPQHRHSTLIHPTDADDDWLADLNEPTVPLTKSNTTAQDSADLHFGNDDWLADLNDAELAGATSVQPKSDGKFHDTSHGHAPAPSPTNTLIKRASRTSSRLWAERAKHAEVSSRTHRSYVRCKVMAVRESIYSHTLPNSTRTVERPEIIVYGIEKPRRAASFRHDDYDAASQAAGPVSTITNTKTAFPGKRKIVLREEWTATRVYVGDYIHCVGNWEDRHMDEYDHAALTQIEHQASRLEQEREARWSGHHINQNQTKKEELCDESFPLKQEENHTQVQSTGDEVPPSSFKSAGAADLFADLDDAALTGHATFDPTPQPTILTMDLLSSSPLSDSIHADNLLVLHPDVLVTATAVCDVPTCVRKPLVKSRINTSSASDKCSQPLVMGNMLHEVLQACLTGVSLLDSSSVPPLANEEALKPYLHMPFPLKWYGPGKTDFSLAFLVRQVKVQILNNLEGLLCCGLETISGEEKLLELCRPFGDFSQRYLEDAMAVRSAAEQANKDPDRLLQGLFRGVDGMLHMAGVFNENATVLDSRTTVPTLARVTHVFDAEEEIWSPMYGLKGKMDVSVEVELQETEVERPAWRGGNHFVPGQQPPQNGGPDSSTRTSASFYRRTQSTPQPHQGIRRGLGEAKKSYASIMPLEIKTGRSVDALEHRAQTMLYTLMMSDRYGTDVNSGLLYYTRSGDMHRVKRTRNEVRGLIVGRNELAYWIRRNGRDGDEGEETQDAANSRRPPQGRADSNGVIQVIDEDDDDNEGTTALPPGIDSERECGRCFAQNGCMLYRRALDRIVEDEDNPSEVAPLYSRITSHLSPAQAAFFEKWERLLSLEEEDMVKFKRELWTLTAVAREEVGRCFANMAVDPEPIKHEHTTRTAHTHTYRFLRKEVAGTLGQSLLRGSMSSGDPVVVSIEPATFSVAQGFIVDVNTHSVTVGLDHHLDAVLERAAVEQGVQVQDPAKLDITFRIDRDEFSDGMAKIRASLAHLFYSLDERDHRHREMIVDLAPPRFDYSHPLSDDSLPDHLNEDQRAAMKKVFAARDYALVLGMPGTGKTTTIAEMIKLLVARGNTILLASYTHSAVDTILRKLRKAKDVRMLRLGNVDRVHADLKDYTLPKASTVEELNHLINTPNVIATTCLSTGHATFARRRFDYCIVDEASQITLPTCLGPLRFADRFVLVGDHFQLPPLVRNNVARKGGLDVSLFKRLSEAHNSAVVYLTRQYRMNESIMLLSNHLIYDGLLKCGNEAVARQVLSLPRREFALAEIHRHEEGEGASGLCPGMRAPPGPSQCWIERLLAESCQAVFVDTDAVPGHESRRGRMVQNEVEASIIQQLARALVLGGVPRSDIAVITPYRQQLKLLNALLLHNANGDSRSSKTSGEIEIMTADRSQGRDKPVVLISLVRSNDMNARGRGSGIGELLNDWRRINVALTRAQRKVVIVGSQSTLSAAPLLEDFFGLMREQSWIVKLPRDAVYMHPNVEKALGESLNSGSQSSHKTQSSSQRRVRCVVKREGAAVGVAGDENEAPSQDSKCSGSQRFVSTNGLGKSRGVFEEIQASSQEVVKAEAAETQEANMLIADRPQKRKREAGSSRTNAIEVVDESDGEDGLGNGERLRRDEKVGEAILRRRPILRDAMFAE